MYIVEVTQITTGIYRYFITVITIKINKNNE